MCRISKAIVKVGAVSVVLALLATGGAFAQPQDQNQMRQDQNATASPAGQQAMAAPSANQPSPANSTLEKAHQLLSWAVVNKEGEKLGTLDDIVLDDHDMSISYGALSYGGLAGVGSKLFAVPWSEFQVRPENKTLVLDARVDALKAAAGFDRNHWPAAGDKNWTAQGSMSSSPSSGMSSSGMSNEQAQPAREGMMPQPGAQGQTEMRMIPIKYRRVTQLYGLVARDRESKELADLQDVILDVHEGPNDGRVAYGLVAVRTGFMDLNKKFAVVPWTAVEVVPAVNGLRIDTTKQALEAVAFDEGHFPNLQDQRYAQDLHRRFEARPYWEALGYVPNERSGSMAAKPGEATGDVSAWRSDSAYNKRFDASKVTTLQGTIQSLDTFKPEPNSLEGVFFKIKLNDGTVATVQAGPRPFMDRQELKLAYGDKVAVTAAPTEAGGVKTYIASKIQKDNSTLVLRGDDGKPKWDADKLVTPPPAAPKSTGMDRGQEQETGEQPPTY